MARSKKTHTSKSSPPPTTKRPKPNTYLSLLLLPPIYYSIFTLITYLIGLTPLALTPYILLSLHLPTIIATSSIFLPSFKRIFRQIQILDHHILRPTIPLLASLIVYLTLSFAFANYYFPPENHDAVNHGFMIQQILKLHTNRYDQIFRDYTDAVYYPLGFHQFTASLSPLIQTPNPANLAFQISWLFSSLTPLAIYLLARTTLRSSIASSMASLASISFFAFPYYNYAWGGWPMIVGVVLLWYSLALWHHAWHRQSLPHLYLTWLLLAAIFLTHPMELPTFVVFATLVSITKLPTMWQHFQKLWPHLFLTAIFSLLISLPFLTSLQRLSGYDHSADQPVSQMTIAEALEYFYTSHFQLNQNHIIIILGLVGILFAFFNPTTFALSIIATLPLIAWLNRLTTPSLNPLQLLTFPLLEDVRLIPIIAGTLSITAGVSIKILKRFLSSKLAPYSHIPKQLPQVLIWTVLLVSLILTVPKTTTLTRQFLDYYVAVRPTEVELWQRNANTCQTYLIDPKADAGRPIPLLTNANTLLPPAYQLLSDLDQRLKLTYTATSAASLSDFHTLNQDYQVDCLFYGEKKIRFRTRELKLQHLSSNPSLQLLDQSGDSRIYQMASLEALPSILDSLSARHLIIHATNSALLDEHVIGQLSPIGTSLNGVQYRSVNQYVEVWTKDPVNYFSVTGRSYTDSPQTCQLILNDRLLEQITIEPIVNNYFSSRLSLEAGQKKLALYCPTAPGQPYAFTFTSINLE